MSERDPECCKTGVHLPPISPPVKPEPRTSEPSEADDAKALQLAIRIRQVMLRHDRERVLTFEQSVRHLADCLLGYRAEVARAAKVEALSEVAKAGCTHCFMGVIADPTERYGRKWWHGYETGDFDACSRPEVWDALQALQEGGR